MRGTHLDQVFGQAVNRFIPASAGNARTSGASAPLIPVHPRECGERSTTRARDVASVGSSPRVRGTRRKRRRAIRWGRFIPASAGNARLSGRPLLGAAVHPRECGERAYHAGETGVARGSSPRVRGTHAEGVMRTLHERFIPASAGNAARRARARWRWPVHPRECGERTRLSNTSFAAIGSSPRVRGTHQPRMAATRPCRFIPASAGNASCRCCR